MAVIGMHALLDFYGASVDALTDAKRVADALLAAAHAAGMTPLGIPVVHTFPGGGLTAFLPLAESHIAVHTYPERAYLAADIFTCGAPGVDPAVEVLLDRFAPSTSCVRIVDRGSGIDE